MWFFKPVLLLIEPNILYMIYYPFNKVAMFQASKATLKLQNLNVNTAFFMFKYYVSFSSNEIPRNKI